MISYDGTFGSYLARLVHRPVYYITISGTTGVFSSQTLGSYNPWIYDIGNVSPAITPEEGKSSISGFDFSLLDVDGEITGLLKTSNYLQNNTASVYLGFNGMATASYVPVFSGKIANIEADGNGLTPGYSFALEDSQRSLKTSIFNLATASNQAVVTANPIDIILGVLISTSTGGTDAYDFLTGGGLGIARANIDVAKFEEIRDGWFDGWTFKFRAKKPIDNVKTWMEQQILRPCSCHLTVNGSGQLSLAYLGTSMLTQGAPVLDEDNAAVKSYDFNWSALVNKLSMYYDFSETAGKYWTHNYYIDSTSRVNRGFSDVLKYELKGVHGADSPEGDQGGDDIIDTIKTRVLARWTNPRPRAKVSVFLKDAGQLAEVGDRITYSNTKLPNPVTGTRGIDQAVWEIHKKSWDFNSGVCTFEMENAGADYQRYMVLAPSTTVSGAATSLMLPVRDASGFDIGNKIEVYCTGSDWPTGTISNIVGNTIYLDSALSKVPLQDAIVQYAPYGVSTGGQKAYPFVSDTGATYHITAGSTTTVIKFETASSLHYNQYLAVNLASGEAIVKINSMSGTAATVEALPLAPADNDTATPLMFADGLGAYLVG